jgi:hypothetical protein
MEWVDKMILRKYNGRARWGKAAAIKKTKEIELEKIRLGYNEKQTDKQTKIREKRANRY